MVNEGIQLRKGSSHGHFGINCGAFELISLQNLERLTIKTQRILGIGVPPLTAVFMGFVANLGFQKMVEDD